MNISHLIMRFVHQGGSALGAALTFAALPMLPAGATEIWNGPPMTFINLDGSDPTQPSSQDRIAPDVWLTRGAVRGLYNAAVESSYGSLSPVGTEWAYGELPDYASLNYQTWVVWNGKNPPAMVGQDAVLHIIPDDIYLAIQFTSWNERSGGFSYSRSTPPAVPEPSTALLALAGTAAFAGMRFGQKARKWQNRLALFARAKRAEGVRRLQRARPNRVGNAPDVCTRRLAARFCPCPSASPRG